MKLIYWGFILPLAVYSQDFNFKTKLHNDINESSGLLYLHNHLLTHNDSGDLPALYEISPDNGTILRTTQITNAINKDWEDLAMDDTYIYVGDFGNNSGSRRDLKIYRIKIDTYLDPATTEIEAEIINFSYEDQENYIPTQFKTNFDAEAFIVLDDSLYIFTKNWGDHKTNIYKISKNPGTYKAKRIDQIYAKGLITAATYNKTFNEIVLTGYTMSKSFVLKISEFKGDNFSDGVIERFSVKPSFGKSHQIEGISYAGENNYFITAEKGILGGISALYTFTDAALTIENFDQSSKEVVLYPNPARDSIFIQLSRFKSLRIYDMNGTLVKKSRQKELDISDLKPGTYMCRVQVSKTNTEYYKKLIVR